MDDPTRGRRVRAPRLEEPRWAARAADEDVDELEGWIAMPMQARAESEWNRLTCKLTRPTGLLNRKHRTPKAEPRGGTLGFPGEGHPPRPPESGPHRTFRTGPVSERCVFFFLESLESHSGVAAAGKSTT